MTKTKTRWILFLIIVWGYQASSFSFAQDLGWKELIEQTNQEAHKPDHKFYYGEGDIQFGDLWLPESAGPHPVVVMIHGGCWLSSIPGVVLMELICNDLRDNGIAVWNLEYRRVGHKGGGYPGTFLDVARGADYIKNPLKFNAVISLAGIGDLKQFREYGNLVCADGVVDKLVAREQRTQENPFLDTSPIELLPENTPQILIHGVYDPIVPPYLGYAYKRK